MKITDRNIILSWDDVFELLRPIDRPGQIVYGVPKGGMIAAGFLREAAPTHNPFVADLILDDLIDSGRTAELYHGRFPTIPFAALLDKRKLPPEQQRLWVLFPWEADHPNVGDRPDTVEQNVERCLQFLGEDTARAGLRDTPTRVVRSWAELYKGYHTDPKDFIRSFDEGDGFDEVVVLRDCEIFSVCEHHMLPFFGRAHVAYLPSGGKLLGISKLARLVETFSRRLQIQERIGKQVTDFLTQEVGARGAACIIEAEHLCMRMRGVNKQNSVMVTSSLQGVFRDDASARAELMQLIARR